MPVFMNTGGGDIYAAETKEQCIQAMKDDLGEEYFIDIEDEIYEVDSSAQMRVENEDGSDGPLSTLAEEYTNLGHGYCIASTNC